MAERDREQGAIKRFNKTSGYGFIVPDLGGDDLFLHVTRIRNMPEDGFIPTGQRAEYEVKMSHKGLMATGVQLIGETSCRKS